MCVCACMFECMCVTVSVRVHMQMQASGWTASLPQSLSTYSLRCGFTIEPKAHWHSWSIKLAHSYRHWGWVLVCCLPNSRVTDRFPCPSDTYMGAKDLLSGPSPVLVLGLTGVFTMSRFPSTNWFGLVFWNMFLLCSLHWVPWDSLCSLAGFGLGLILLPLPCKFWDGIWEPPHPVSPLIVLWVNSFKTLVPFTTPFLRSFDRLLGIWVYALGIRSYKIGTQSNICW